MARLLTRALSRTSLRKVNEALYLVALRGLGFNAAYGDPIPFAEQRMLARLSRWLPHDATIVDVGANQGHYSVAARKCFPSARIFAFEPNPKLHPGLERTAAGWRFEVVRSALGAAEGNGSLFGVASETGSTFASLSGEVVAHSAKKYGQIEVGSVSVPVTTLDEFAQARGIDRIDLLKIDVEGHELSVLRGGQRLLRSGRVRCIQLEFNECSLFTRTQFRDLRDALDGYRIGRLLYSGQLLRLEYDPKWCEIYSYQVLVAERIE